MVTEPVAALGGRYALAGLLGRGGMAEVHLARDLRLDRAVAVKVLRPDFAADATYRERFRREALSVAALNHPNVVAVHDTGEGEFGGVRLPYLVTEYVDGLTLAELLHEEGPLTPQRALSLVAPLLDALAYAHAAGIVHRDIKPANVMVTRTGLVKVMDFGIARSLGQPGGTLTQWAMVVGTPEYISPEQASGERVDARTDLYSVGCLSYELLTGRPPFTGENPVAVAFAQVRQEPGPPSGYAPAVPAACDALVLRALAKDREARFQSAAEMRAALDGVLRELERPAAVAAPRPTPRPTGRAAYTPTVVEGAPVAPTRLAPAPGTGTAAAPASAAPRRRSRRPVLLTAVAGMAAAVVGTGITMRVAEQNHTPATVPYLVGSTLADARQQAAHAGLRVATSGVGSCPAPAALARAVCSQSPAAGASLTHGATIRVQVSRLG
jgi:serine/threonine-protein kinase